MKKTSTSSGRVSVQVPERVRAAAGYPELVGLPKGASTPAIYERLLEYGYDAAIRARREQQQLAAAIAYERDPERHRVAADLQRASLRSRCGARAPGQRVTSPAVDSSRRQS